MGLNTCAREPGFKHRISSPCFSANVLSSGRSRSTFATWNPARQTRLLQAVVAGNVECRRPVFHRKRAPRILTVAGWENDQLGEGGQAWQGTKLKLAVQRSLLISSLLQAGMSQKMGGNTNIHLTAFTGKTKRSPRREGPACSATWQVTRLPSTCSCSFNFHNS